MNSAGQIVLSGNAHLVAGGKEMIEKILSVLEGSGITTRGNPDIYVQ